MKAEEADSLRQRAEDASWYGFPSTSPSTTERDASVDRLLAWLDADVPVVRHEVVAAARARLAGGERPSAEVLAGTLVAELVDQRRQ